MELKDLAPLITALGGGLGAVLAILKYLSLRDKQLAAQQAFKAVVESLSSEIEGQRLGGAILLRRFFDPKTELGEGGTPYSREALNVIAAILRESKTGNFQKLLADGLLYAPSLEFADLQRTNLQNAYLGKKGKRIPNLRHADFYRSDLTGASLKGADATGAIFYQTRMLNTILKGTTLCNAMFFESDLLGASFKDANLTGARFIRCRNMPKNLANNLRGTTRNSQESIWRRIIKAAGLQKLPAVNAESKPSEAQSEAGGESRPQIFISRPSALNIQQEDFLRFVTSIILSEDITVVNVSRADYPNVGAIGEVRRVLCGCSGILVLGFRQLEVTTGIWRLGTNEARNLENVALPTTWNHIEAGMAAMAGLPMLMLVEDTLIKGIFDLGGVGNSVLDINLTKPNNDEIRDAIQNWCHSIRETHALNPTLNLG